MGFPTLIGLHGFGGSGASWDAVRAALVDRGWPEEQIVTPDLRGHGTAAAVRPVDLPAVLDDLIALVDAAAANGPVVVAGYSMGGRIGFQLALARPERLRALASISSTSGLDDETERAERRAADARLAERLRDEGSARFADAWVQLPLWDGDPPDVRAAQRAELASGDAEGLAEALRGLGPGAVPAVGDRLAALAVPLLVVSGSRDRRYGAIATRLVGLAPQPAGHVVVPDAGHGLLREAPTAVAAALLTLCD